MNFKALNILNNADLDARSMALHELYLFKSNGKTVMAWKDKSGDIKLKLVVDKAANDRR